MKVNDSNHGDHEATFEIKDNRAIGTWRITTPYPYGGGWEGSKPFNVQVRGKGEKRHIILGSDSFKVRFDF